ncbi:MAG: rRNA maturation RNase YbeY [bacterium]|nr:rRNA maturation RNase YbeY [bacterium]
MVSFETPASLHPFAAKLTRAVAECWPELWANRTKTTDIIKVTLVSPESMRKSNLKYRSLDKPTDVLSFPLYQALSMLPPTDTLLGDIIICPKMCSQKHLSVNESLIHGTLHLFGFDHEANLAEWERALTQINKQLKNGSA